MFRKLLSLIGIDKDDSKKMGNDSVVSKSGLSTDNWVWERVDEYPFPHYTDAIEDVKQLKREKAHEEVEDLLLWCIDFAEVEAEWERTQGYGFGIPPAYYRHLAIVYRKDDRYLDEISILRRYMNFCETMGEYPKENMIDRIERARELAERN